MGNQQVVVGPQKGLEEIKGLQSEKLALKNRLHRALKLLCRDQLVAFGKLKNAQNKVRKFHLYKMKLKQLERKSRSKDLADKTEKVQSELRKARAEFEQAQKFFNDIIEKEKKFLAKLKGLSS